MAVKMVMENIIIWMEINIKGNEFKIKRMVKVFINIKQLVNYIMVND